ncbi:Aste57867_9754 [Aphanomyces stellatus]|uniref:Aste57867_9754 protein n=1 Tax=Aphanomyces stellatus TaxID=120398 RepID=A0A485KNZ6_9STRA|nr:hypothetical protein As57867_009715 [Aphanomyces stellatus]VFT86633.1 Aste57867_9754 [Aphanomyces stellatus]
MGQRRTLLKNLAKRRKRKVHAQLHAELERDMLESHPEEVERLAMADEEASQRCHAKWVTANAKADAAFAKKKRILEERKRLMEDIKQQMEQETLEKEVQEREERDAAERQLVARREIERKQWTENVHKMTSEQKKMLLCSFFIRTGVCRFGDHCSRIHAPPSAPGRFVLFPGMHTIGVRSHRDGDDHLELDEREMRDGYRAFYFDALVELLKFGHLVQLNTCCNTASHLRGNVYVEYQTAQQAADAREGLYGRWYAGRQLLPEVTPISSWSDAICGLFLRKRCVRGGDCNFLHPFVNPVEPDPPLLAYRSPERGTSKRKRSPSPDRRHRRSSERTPREDDRHRRKRSSRKDEREDERESRRRHGIRR